MLSVNGGSLQIEDNLDGGTVATLIAGDDPVDAHSVGTPSPSMTAISRHILALLLELGTASAETLAEELSLDLCVCGRDLCVLEQHGVVNRAPDGTRSLTPGGADILTSLF